MVYSTHENPKELIRVSMSEAARLFGVNAQTIRRAISAQEITYVVVGGRYKLNFESLVKWSQRRTTTKNKLAKKGIGQFVEQWKIKNPLYSPNPKALHAVVSTEQSNENQETLSATEVVPTPTGPLHTT
jgi:excisionase family DNA binding protein